MFRNFFLGGFASIYRSPEMGGGDGGSSSSPAPATTATTQPSAPSATPSGSTPASPAGTPTSSTGSTPAPAGQAPDSDLADGNWRQARQRIEELRNNLDGYSKFGKPEEIASRVQLFEKVHTEASTIAKALGYSDTELKEAFDADPIQTLQILREEQAKAATAPNQQAPGQQPPQQTPDEARIRAMINDATKPYTEHLNKQLSDAVVAKIGTELNTAINEALPGVPDEVSSMVRDYVEEALAHSPQVLAKMKREGEYSAVKDHVVTIAGRLKQSFAKWVAHETARTGGRGTAPASSAPATTGQNRGTQRLTLDQIINDPSVLGDQYAE